MALLMSAGCTPHKPELPRNTAHWQISFSVTPARPRQLDPTETQVQVTDSSKRPVSGAAISVQLAMPAMDMGRNDVTLHETRARGTYAGTGRFTMPGDWQATVQADKGPAHQSQTFPISVR